MVFVFCLSNLLAEAGWAAESRVGINVFFSFLLSLITLRIIVVMSFPDSSPDVGYTLHSHREGSSKRCKEQLSLLLLHHTRGAQGSFEKPDRTSVSKWATNPSSSLSVSFVGCKIVIAASSEGQFSPVSCFGRDVTSTEADRSCKSSHCSSPKFLFVEKMMCFFLWG